MIDFNKIYSLRQEIHKLLQEKPELLPLQEAIDKALQNAGSQYNKCAIITDMMLKSLHKLAEEWTR